MLYCRVASVDKMRPASIAKLAIQCSDFYADAVKLLQLESIKSLWPKVCIREHPFIPENVCLSAAEVRKKLSLS